MIPSLCFTSFLLFPTNYPSLSCASFPHRVFTQAFSSAWWGLPYPSSRFCLFYPAAQASLPRKPLWPSRPGEGPCDTCHLAQFHWFLLWVVAFLLLYEDLECRSCICLVHFYFNICKYTWDEKKLCCEEMEIFSPSSSSMKLTHTSPPL